MAARAAAPLALALIASACLGRAEAGGVLRVASVSGVVEHRVPGEVAWKQLAPGTVLGPGGEIRAQRGALVRLSSGKDAVELDGGKLRVAAGDRIVLVEGRALVEAAEHPMTISDESETIVARATKGIFRLDLGRRVAVYEGSAEVRFIQSYPVSRLRELALATGEPELRPMRLDRDDRWDRRLLAEALELDRGIENVALEGTYGAQVRDPAFYEARVQPSSAVAFLRAGPLQLTTLLREVAPTDVLVGIVVGLRIAENPGQLGQKFGEVIVLFRSGASWGLVAAELGLSGTDVLASLEQALTPGAPPQTVQPPRRPGSRQTREPSPTPTRSASPRPTRSPSPSPSPTTSTSPSPSPSPCTPLDELLGNCTPGG